MSGTSDLATRDYIMLYFQQGDLRAYEEPAAFALQLRTQLETFESKIVPCSPRAPPQVGSLHVLLRLFWGGEDQRISKKRDCLQSARDCLHSACHHWYESHDIGIKHKLDDAAVLKETVEILFLCYTRIMIRAFFRRVASRVLIGALLEVPRSFTLQSKLKEPKESLKVIEEEMTPVLLMAIFLYFTLYFTLAAAWACVDGAAACAGLRSKGQKPGAGEI